MVACCLEIRKPPRSLRREQVQLREQERISDDGRGFGDEARRKESGGCFVVPGGDQVGRHQQDVVRYGRTIRVLCLQECIELGKGDFEEVLSAADIQGDPANPPGPLVDELALGGRRGRGDLFGKVDGIKVASVANEGADAVDVGDEAWIGGRLSRRRRRQGGGRDEEGAGHDAKGADPPSGEGSEAGFHGLTVSRKARSLPGERPTRLLMSVERGSPRS